MPDLTEREIRQAHTIDDLSTQLACLRNAVSDARDLLSSASSAMVDPHATDRDALVQEFLDRAYLRLGRACADAQQEQEVPA